MSYGKKRLAVFLSMLVVLMTVFELVPAQEVQAASTVYLSFEYDELLVQKGDSDLYMGDYITAFSSGSGYYKYYGYLTNNSKVTYKSSNSAVIGINSTTGKMTAKKNGTAKITVTFKGSSLTKKIQVVKSTQKYQAQGIKNASIYKKGAVDYVKAYGKGVTAKNRYKLASISKMTGGFYYNNIGACDRYENNTGKWIVTDATYVHASVLHNNLERYAEKLNPLSTTSAKTFNIQKLSGKGNTVTATLKSKVTADQIYGLQYSESWSTEIAETTKVEFPIYVQDMSTGHRYYAVATVKKGSDKMTIKTKNLTLKKGRQYRLREVGTVYYDPYKNWLDMSKVSKFKAK